MTGDAPGEAREQVRGGDRGDLQDEARKGVLAILGACVIWGLAPIFYRHIGYLPTSEIVAHRILWSLVFFVGLLAAQGRLGALKSAVTERDQLGWIAGAALIISFNWFFFVYAIQIGRLTEASLGYYISPLLSVLLGFVVFRERLAGLQWAAVALAAAAVVLLTAGLGAAPWISLILASTFAVYGVVKKKVRTGPVVSVTAEVLLVLPVVLVWLLAVNEAPWPDAWTLFLLIFSGPLTALPLILFSYAAKRISFSTLGLVQYLNPTMQFLIAATLFAEPVTGWHMAAFPMIWLALALYSTVAVARDRSARRAATRASTVGTV